MILNDNDSGFSRREWIAIFLLASVIAWGVFLGGCAPVHVRRGDGGGAATIHSRLSTSRPVRDVCFSRTEVARILAHKARCKAANKRAKVQVRATERTAKIKLTACEKRQEIRARACEEQLRLAAGRRCSTCVLPWIVVGAVVTVAAILGVAWMIREVTPRQTNQAHKQPVFFAP